MSSLLSIRNLVITCLVLLSHLFISPALAKSPSYNAELAEYEYPFAVSTFALHSQNQNLNMRYMLLNPNSKKGSVLLLHGKNFAGYYWATIARELADKGFKVIIPDQIGWGKSSKPEHYQYSFAQLALNTQQLLAHLSVSKVTIVGHSMGGMLATHFTHYYSEMSEQLILINPIGLENYLDYVAIKDPAFFYDIEKNKTLAKAKAYQQRNYYDGQWQPAYDALLEPLKGQLNHPDWPLVAWNNALTYAPIFNESILPVLAKIPQRISLIIGTRDRTGPGRNWKTQPDKKLGQYQILGKTVIKQTRNGSLYELNGLGHMPQFEDYDAFAKVFYPLFESR